MLALEVLEICPRKKKALLCVVNGIGLFDTNIIAFNLDKSTPSLPPQVAFQIQLKSQGVTIYHTVVDEVASTCVMHTSCWKALWTPTLAPSPTMLQAFDGHLFQPKGIILGFPVELGWKNVNIGVEDFDSPFDYNILLGWSWYDDMHVVVFGMVQVICFPHEGKVVTINQL